MLFTDDCTIVYEGIIYTHLCPVWVLKITTLPRPHQWHFVINFWAGIVHDSLIGLCHVDSNSYLVSLQEVLPKLLTKTLFQNTWLQHYRTLVHYAAIWITPWMLYIRNGGTVMMFQPIGQSVYPISYDSAFSFRVIWKASFRIEVASIQMQIFLPGFPLLLAPIKTCRVFLLVYSVHCIDNVMPTSLLASTMLISWYDMWFVWL